MATLLGTSLVSSFFMAQIQQGAENIPHTTTSQRCCIGLLSLDGGGHLSNMNLLK